MHMVATETRVIGNYINGAFVASTSTRTLPVVSPVDGSLLAEGETTHIVTDAAMKIAALPEKYLKVFRSALGKQDGKLS